MANQMRRLEKLVAHFEGREGCEDLLAQAIDRRDDYAVLLATPIVRRRKYRPPSMPVFAPLAMAAFYSVFRKRRPAFASVLLLVALFTAPTLAQETPSPALVENAPAFNASTQPSVQAQPVAQQSCPNGVCGQQARPQQSRTWVDSPRLLGRTQVCAAPGCDVTIDQGFVPWRKRVFIRWR